MRWILLGGLIGLAAFVERTTGAPDATVAAFVLAATAALLAALVKVRRPTPVPSPLAGARWADWNDAIRLASPGAF